MAAFQCNICGAKNRFFNRTPDREGVLCSSCNSNTRIRSVLLSLSRALFGCDLALPEFPVLKSVHGLGLSDSEAYARRLETLFTYSNTYLHREPRFDVTQPDPGLGQFDFILCSEVLEHVAPPVERAFAALRAMLKPEGALILTVPYGLGPATAESFEALDNPTLVTVQGKPLVVGRAPGGGFAVREDLVFHGGPGATLEMRTFSEADLRAQLLRAGFESVVFDAAGSVEFGVEFSGPCSLPIRAGGLTLSRAHIGELAEEFGRLRLKLIAARESRWFRLGRRLGLGPRL